MGKFAHDMPERNSGGDYFKFSEGKNIVRVASDGAWVTEHFKKGICYGKSRGCKNCAEGGDTPSTKKMFHIIDRKDNKFKIAKFGVTLIEQLDAMSEDENYQFDSFPMPFDINIIAKGAGTKEVTYTLMPSPHRIELTDGEKNILGKLHTPKEIVKAMKTKKMKEDGTWVEGILDKEEKPARTVTVEKGYHYPTAEEEGIDLDATWDEMGAPQE
jgi:hypothetical protein